MPEEDIFKQEGKENLDPREGMEKAPPLERELTPEQRKELERKKEALERKLQEAKKQDIEDLEDEERQKVHEIAEKAQIPSGIGSVPSDEATADRLVEAVIKGNESLKHALHAAQDINPRTFDKLCGLLQSEDILEELKEKGEIE